MEKKRGRDRKSPRRLWGFLGGLWLVIACLAGCAVPGIDGGNQAGGDRGAVTSVSEAADGGERSRGPGSEEAADGESEAGGPKSKETEGKATETKKNAAEKPEMEDGRNGVEGDKGIEESGTYTSKGDVALYLHTYGRLPENYITKRDAEELGWDSKKGNLWDVAPGMSIGGSRFGNYEGALPDRKGRKYFECDIDYEGGYRGAKRLVYSDDGLIYYTEDHYNTFEQLYGE